jgi:hypothetical protein
VTGISQDPGPAAGAATGRQRALTVAGYVMLFVLGAVQGLFGSFQYAREPAPLIAVILVVVVLVTCAGCGWGIGTFAAALLPALGWIVVSFVLAMSRPNGSVIITATVAGECYLYGGALAVAVGCVASFYLRVRRPAPPR